MKARTYISKGLLVFAFLGFEFLLLALEYMIFDLPRGAEFNLWNPLWYRTVIHWSLTILLWSIGCIYFYKWSKKNDVLQDLFSFQFHKKTAVLSVITILLCLGLNYLVDVKLEGSKTFPQVYGEFKHFKEMYGNKAVVMSVFQNLYYVAESLLVVWIVAFMQKAGEIWTHRKFVWGALGLTLTWGIIHFLSHPVGALFTTAGAFIFGAFYLMTKKSLYPVFLFILLTFIF